MPHPLLAADGVDSINNHRILRLDDKGSSAVEFAMIAPIFLALLLGIVAYGICLGVQHSTAQLAADAARASVSGRTDAERTALATQHVAAAVSSYPLLNISNVAVSVAPISSDPTEFQVTVTYDASALPIWGLAQALTLAPKKLVSSSVIKDGGY